MNGWLVDKSALVRFGDSPDAIEWASRIDRGLVRITSLTLLEVGYSARTAHELSGGVRRPPLSSMPVSYLTPSIEDRALQVQLLLAERGLHRTPSVPDLLIAAAAELTGLCVLHVDKDFAVITGVTGQPVERLATRA